MACKSPSLKRVVDKSGEAKTQVENLEKQIADLQEGQQENFEQQISQFGQRAKITDFRELIYNSAIKTEYSHEFSLDKIAPVIGAALEAVANSLTGSAVEILTSEDAVKSYSDLVLSITEAAKSRSSASSSLSFNANRIAPGVHAFISANSLSMNDQQTFGEEAVTATSVLYSLNNSIEDLKQTLTWELAYLDAENLIKLKRIQIGYTDDLANGEITIAVWQEKNKRIMEAIDRLQQRVNAAKFADIAANAKNEDVPVNSDLFEVEPSKILLEKAIHQFEDRGSLYESAILTSKDILQSPLFA